MPLNYQIVENITNTDFLGSNRDILEKCEKVNQKYRSNDLRGCLSESRIVLEAFVHYMYKRLTNNRNIPHQLGKLIDGTDFKLALNNAKIISEAEKINSTTRKYHHPEKRDYETKEEYIARIKYEDEQEVPIATSEVLEQLSLFLSLAVEVINNEIPSERGGVKFSLQDTYFDNSDTTERVLESDLIDVDDKREYGRTWAIKGTEGKLRNTRRSLVLKDNFLGKIIVFTATNQRTKQTITAEIGPIEKKHLLLGGPEDIPYEMLTSKPIKQPKPPVEPPKPPVEPPKPHVAPPKRKSIAEEIMAELAIERTKTQEDYDKEE